MEQKNENESKKKVVGISVCQIRVYSEHTLLPICPVSVSPLFELVLTAYVAHMEPACPMRECSGGRKTANPSEACQSKKQTTELACRTT